MGLSLPPGVTVEKVRIQGQWVYEYHHDTLGQLGRIVLQGMPNGQCNVLCEVSGEDDDPMTMKRLSILQPLSEQVIQAMTTIVGEGDQDQAIFAPNGPAGEVEIVETKRLPCEECGEDAALLVFGEDASTVGEFEDYARKLYHTFTALNVPTWIIGEAQGTPGFDTPSKILKVWPERGSIEHLTPNHFNAELDALLANHCKASR